MREHNRPHIFETCFLTQIGNYHRQFLDQPYCKITCSIQLDSAGKAPKTGLFCFVEKMSYIEILRFNAVDIIDNLVYSLSEERA